MKCENSECQHKTAVAKYEIEGKFFCYHCHFHVLPRKTKFKQCPCGNQIKKDYGTGFCHACTLSQRKQHHQECSSCGCKIKCVQKDSTKCYNCFHKKKTPTKGVIDDTKGVEVAKKMKTKNPLPEGKSLDLEDSPVKKIKQKRVYKEPVCLEFKDDETLEEKQRQEGCFTKKTIYCERSKDNIDKSWMTEEDIQKIISDNRKIRNLGLKRFLKEEGEDVDSDDE